MMRLVFITFLLLFTFNIEAAETTYHCRQYQSDIDYWQNQYARVIKLNKELYKELMEAKMEILKRGIKIPEALKNTEIILPKRKKQSVTHNYYYY